MERFQQRMFIKWLVTALHYSKKKNSWMTPLQRCFFSKIVIIDVDLALEATMSYEAIFGPFVFMFAKLVPIDSFLFVAFGNIKIELIHVQILTDDICVLLCVSQKY